MPKKKEKTKKGKKTKKKDIGKPITSFKVITEKGKVVVPEVKIIKHQEYNQFYVTNTKGGPFGPYDFRMIFFKESLKRDEDSSHGLILEQEEKTSVIMSMVSSKLLLEWLKNHIDEYEKRFGNIQTEEKHTEG